MDCKKFKKHIHDYFSNPNFDLDLKDEMDRHYFECDNCFKIYQIARLMADVDIKKLTLKELAAILIEKAFNNIEKHPEDAVVFLKRVIELDSKNDKIIVLLNSIIKVFFNRKKQDIVIDNNKITCTINEPVEVLIEYANKQEWSEYITEDDIFSQREITYHLHSRENRPKIFETDHLIIKFYKGLYSGKVSIEIKE